jgi:anti-sigma regulatory factor (Ser/Thr protein kinase)
VIISIDIPRDLCAPARARRAIAGLGGRIDAELLPDVTLLVSELVTNSVKYGGPGNLVLRARSQHRRHIHVEVLDHGHGFVPELRTRPAGEAGGWGLHLVQQLTDRWGVEDDAGHVWFEIDRQLSPVSG